MSQQRVRKAGPVETRRATMGKAAGDSGVAAPTNHIHSSNSRTNKIPKGLRYELENALVGLCDVWFEEIKPHLVRNNIKLHVHGSGPGSGDHRRLPPGAPGCSHLDPALSAGVCQLCRLLFNAANSIESAVSQAACAAPAGLPAAAKEVALIPSAKPPRAVQRRRSPRRRTPLAATVGWRTPRLCRTYSVLAPGLRPPPRRTHTASPHINSTRCKRKPKKLNKSTQTPNNPMQLPVSRLRVPDTLRTPNALLEPDTGRCSDARRTPDARRAPDTRLTSDARRSPDTRLTSDTRCVLRQEARPEKCQRCPANTTLAQLVRQKTLPIVPLFKDNLIDIIVEKNDKRLKLLFTSPCREHSTLSSLNLMPSRGGKARQPGARKMPWR